LLALKLFVDNNFDEPSSVLSDINSKWDNVDLNLDVDSGEARLDVFKMHENFTTNVQTIVGTLPGDSNEINLQPRK
jgi:hypothetical protein